MVASPWDETRVRIVMGILTDRTFCLNDVYIQDLGPQTSCYVKDVSEGNLY